MDEEYAKRKKAAEAALANLRLEGLELDNYSKELMEKVVNGEITTDQMREELDKRSEEHTSELQSH